MSLDEEVEDEPTELEVAKATEQRLGKILWEALNANHPTLEQLKERKRVARKYVFAVEELLEEMRDD